VKFRGQAPVVLEAGGDVLHVELGFDDGLAGVGGLERGQFCSAAADDARQPQKDAAPLHGRRARPIARVEGPAGRGNGGVDVGVGRLGDLRDALARRGIQDVPGFGAPPLDEGPADEQLPSRRRHD
jgi:hypothetical protein